eukprot:7450721-Pyramimonas_sp.AAC.1
MLRARDRSAAAGAVGDTATRVYICDSCCDANEDGVRVSDDVLDAGDVPIAMTDLAQHERRLLA